MGREIVRQVSTSEPDGRSRLWSNEDIVHALEENTVFESLSLLDFEGCKFLTELRSLFGVPNLTTLGLNKH
ncbi:hypothetical protein JHK82_050014 [Glycine max]|nr:hypothetical protein JHK82_050014 [Glycine max]